MYRLSILFSRFLVVLLSHKSSLVPIAMELTTTLSYLKWLDTMATFYWLVVSIRAILRYYCEFTILSVMITDIKQIFQYQSIVNDNNKIMMFVIYKSIKSSLKIYHTSVYSTVNANLIDIYNNCDILVEIYCRHKIFISPITQGIIMMLEFLA